MAEGRAEPAADCVITAPEHALSFTVLANDAIAPGESVVIGWNPPEAGQGWLEPQGLGVTFTPGEVTGLITARYFLDETGAAFTPERSAPVHLLVNPELPPASENVAADPGLAAACAEGWAKDVLPLTGPDVVVGLPAAGQRVEVTAGPGERIALRHPAFDGMSAFAVEGGWVVITEDGRVVYLKDAGGGDPESAALVTVNADEPLELALLDLFHPPPERLAASTQAFGGELAQVHMGETSPITQVAFNDLALTTRIEAFPDDLEQVLLAGGDLFMRFPHGEPGGAIEAAAREGAAGLGGPLVDLARDAEPAGGQGSIRDQVSGFLLGEAPGGRVVVLGDFAAAAGADRQSVAVGDAPALLVEQVLAGAGPEQVLPGLEGVPVRQVPAALFGAPGGRFEHGGGAGFDTLDHEDLGDPLRPQLEQEPTEPPGGGGESRRREPENPDPNRAPEAEDDLAGTARGAAVEIPVLGNDRDPDGDPIRVAAGSVAPLGAEARPGSAASPAAADPPAPDQIRLARGTATVLDGAIRYEPDPGFVGTERFTYRASDGRAESTPATVIVVVDNRPPVARDDTARTGPGERVRIDVLANDLDPDNAPGLGLAIGGILDGPRHGSLEIVERDGREVVLFRPEPGFTGLDGFRYVVDDRLDFSAPAAVTIRVGEVPNRAPIAQNDVTRTAAGEPVTIAVLANDVDPDGDALSLLGFESPLETGLGVVERAGDLLRYTPNPGVAGEVDRFPYGVTDGALTDGARVTVVIGGIEGRVVALDDTARTESRTPVQIDVLANDLIDPDLPVALEVLPPARGEAFVNLDGRTLTFDPEETFGDLAPGALEAVTFTYTLTQAASSDGATVEVLITGDRGALQPTIAASVDVFAVEETPLVAPPFPELEEGRAQPPAAINGVDQAALVLGAFRDAGIAFLDSVAGDRHALGAYLIDADGGIRDPRVVFADLSALASGAEVRLAELYDPAALAAGGRFGLFLIQNGAALNTLGAGTALRFEGAGGGPATVGDTAPPRLLFADGGEVEGRVLHTAGQQAAAADGVPTNPLNASGLVQTLSGTLDDPAGLAIAFEDRPLGAGDDDFNDARFLLDLAAGTGFDERFRITLDDPDSPRLGEAIVAITAGGRPGDRLQLRDLVDADGDGLLDGTGVRLVEDGAAGRLVLRGAAPLEVYERVLEAVDLVPGPDAEPRTIGFQVFDAGGVPSAIAGVEVVAPGLALAASLADLLAGDAAAVPA